MCIRDSFYPLTSASTPLAIPRCANVTASGLPNLAKTFLARAPRSSSASSPVHTGAASRAAFAAVAKRWRTTGDDRVDARAREVTRRVNARNMAGTVRARGKLTIDTIARSIDPSNHSIHRVDARRSRVGLVGFPLFFSPHTVPRVFSMGNTETPSSRYAATDLCERDTL